MGSWNEEFLLLALLLSIILIIVSILEHTTTTNKGGDFREKKPIEKEITKIIEFIDRFL